MPIDAQRLAKSKRPSRAADVLRYFASVNGSLSYEASMLDQAAKKCATAPPGYDRNAAIECYLVHFRNIRDFLYPTAESWTDERYFDDVIAWDFCSEWLEVAEDWKECSLAERTRINKLLAHISYTRPQLGHDWPIAQMHAAIQNSVSEFVAKLSPDRKKWFEK